MMERTYGRRKPNIPITLSDSQTDTDSTVEYLSSSSSPEMEPLDHTLHTAKRAKNSEAYSFTSTLLEAQEFDELMEPEDEVTFALDRLKKGHQLRIRRASLSSLLSICSSQHQLRSFRAQGISQSIIDTILNLRLDDIPSNLAAATLFFVLTADGQDEHFMESTKCIKFLIKLLKPVIATSNKGKPLNIGFKLLSLLKDVDDEAQDETNINDPSSSRILSTVQELLVNCKEMSDSYKFETTRPELSTKWVALLAMERVLCLSRISLDDTSCSVKKTGGNFKEILRKLGGLDTLLEVVIDCHTVMERWVECNTLSIEDTKDNLHKQSLMLLLKCLKIMENATILSTENQNYLLGLTKRLGSHDTKMCFTELMISVVKMLSGLHLRGGYPSPHRNNVNPHCLNGGNRDSILGADCKGRLGSLGSGIARCTSKTSQVGDPSCKRNGKVTSIGETQDPFAFDLEDSEPYKRAVVSVKQNKSRAQKKEGCFEESNDERLYSLFSSQEESSEHSLDSLEESNDIDEECLCLLSDCLLVAIRVLMNLTNDNALGCQQIGECRGLESMAELIVRHFPSFTRSPVSIVMERMGLSHQKNLTDQELDFLVAILGLLVNLVEKDGMNRSQLASASVRITIPEGLQESKLEMIPLLCSIFLTTQVSTDIKAETTSFTFDYEEAVLKSEKEAEKMIVEAYSALLLAFLSTESRSTRNSIKDYLPKRSLRILVPVLERFAVFHLTLNMISPETHKAVMEVIESCKLP